MSSLASRKVLFFIAGVTPSPTEQALIDAIVGKVQVRSVLQTTTYGSNPEAADAIAALSGTVIPDEYYDFENVTPGINGFTLAANGGQAIVQNNETVQSRVDPLKSTVETALTGANNDLVFTAQQFGTGGDNITIQYVAPTAPNSPLSVEVVGGLAVKVHLATDAGTKQKDTATVVGTITPAAKQVETATAAGSVGASGAGNASVTVTAAGLVGSPLVLAVPVANSDTPTLWAAKVRAALAANAAISALFDVSGATTSIVLTRKVFAANDGTLNIALATGTATGITTAASSANTTAGTLGGGGNAAVVITSADLVGSPITLAVPVIESDTASVVAQKIRNALSKIDAIVGKRPNRVSTAKFIVGGTGATVSLQRTIAKANDGTLNISVDNGTCSGLTTAGTSANTIAGAVPGVVTTATQVKAAVEANPDANNLVTVANAAANTGAGVVTALAATNLAGGDNGTPTDAFKTIVIGGELYGLLPS